MRAVQECADCEYLISMITEAKLICSLMIKAITEAESLNYLTLRSWRISADRVTLETIILETQAELEHHWKHRHAEAAISPPALCPEK